MDAAQRARVASDNDSDVEVVGFADAGEEMDVDMESIGEEDHKPIIVGDMDGVKEPLHNTRCVITTIVLCHRAHDFAICHLPHYFFSHSSQPSAVGTSALEMQAAATDLSSEDSICDVDGLDLGDFHGETPKGLGLHPQPAYGDWIKTLNIGEAEQSKTTWKTCAPCGCPCSI
jgi:hypothetical protein